MPIKDQEPNLLAVNNMRRVSFIPAHFHSFTFDLKSTEKHILDWVYENTESRFYFGRNAKASVTVAFEHHSELGFFALQLPEINSITYQL